MRRELPRIERGGADVSPFVDPSKHRTSVNFRKGKPGAQRFDRPADGEGSGANSGSGAYLPANALSRGPASIC